MQLIERASSVTLMLAGNVISYAASRGCNWIGHFGGGVLLLGISCFLLFVYEALA